MEKNNSKTSKDCLKIVLYGPESTGKTTLAKELAFYYKTNWVAEFARDYLQKKWDEKGEVCSLEDLPIIINGQKALEKKILKKSREIIFCDTNIVVTQIWSQTHFNGYCSPEILKAAKDSNYDFYLLTDIDVPWQKDNLRDRPNDREKMLSVFREVLEGYNFPYKFISGNIKTRLQASIKVIDKLLR